MPRKGRKSKLDKQMISDIATAVAKGMTYKDACTSVGITEGTYYNWMKKAEKAKSGIYFEFLQAVHEAKNKAKNVLVQNLHALAAGGIKVTEKKVERDAAGNIVSVTKTKKVTLPDRAASLAILSRRYPEEWSETTKHELNGKLDGAPIVNIGVMATSDEAQEVMERFVIEDDRA